MDELNELLGLEDLPEGAICECGTQDYEELHEQQKLFVDGQDVYVDVIVIHCKICGCKETDERAEQARHIAVCEARKLLTPDEIRTIREELGDSVQSFSERTGISTASIEKFEKGRVFQSDSQDNVLRMINIRDEREGG
jgi:DNA-binding transcriptional regulator YiaG